MTLAVEGDEGFFTPDGGEKGKGQRVILKHVGTPETHTWRDQYGISVTDHCP